MKLFVSLSILFVCSLSGVWTGCAGSDPANGVRRVSHLQSELIAVLRSELAATDWVQGCGTRKGAHLTSDRYYEIDSHRLLILAGLPDYLCDSSNSFVPVVLTSDGKLDWGKRLAGSPSFLVRDPECRLWLVSQWMIEGTYPLLFRSENGLDWEEIQLPEKRELDCCFEYLGEVRFHHDEVWLGFHGQSDTLVYWSAPADGILHQPAWKRIVQENAVRPGPRTVVTPGNWSRQEDSSQVEFYNSFARLTIIFPKWL